MKSVLQIDDRLFIGGEEVKKPKSLFFENTVCQIDDNIYVNGKEQIKGKWRYTLRSLYYSIF